MNTPAYLLQEKSGDCLLLLWIQPNARKSECAGLHGERLKIRLAAPAIEGRANKELLRFLGKSLAVSPAKLELVAGDTARAKTIRVRDMSCGDLLRRIQAWLPESAP